MTGPPITVASLSTAVEAEVARIRLEAAGIPAVVREGGATSVAPTETGATGATAAETAAAEATAAGASPAPPAGMGELGPGFHVQVAESDFERAMGVLFPLPGQSETKPAPVLRNPFPAPVFPLPSLAGPAAVGTWRCANCQESVDMSSASCWSCGSERPADALVEGALSTGAPDAASKNGQITLEESARMRVAPARPGGVVRRKRPWGMTPAIDTADLAAKVIDTSLGDKAANLAWHASWIGLLFLFLLVPFVLNFYSMCVCLKLGFSNQRLSWRGSWRFHMALLLNGIAFAAALFLLSRL